MKGIKIQITVFNNLFENFIANVLILGLIVNLNQHWVKRVV